MKKQIMVAVLASAAWAFVGGTAMGQPVAGSTTIGVTVEEQESSRPRLERRETYPGQGCVRQQ